MIRESPLEILVKEKEQVNPAILLAEEFLRRDAGDLLSAEDISRAEDILQSSSLEIKILEGQLENFAGLPATPSLIIPVGF
ncbi:MAG: hypothetical protein KF855_11950 [Acidobacteria bacterium]|nr:hypothetical protein [Acidobacteriota bacterium]